MWLCSSRNNNFSNRSQKVTIISVAFLPVWAIVVVVRSPSFLPIVQ